jgi:sulfofructose kinase
MPLDLIFSVDHYPKVGSKIDGHSLCVQGGGPVPNVMIGLSRLGHKTALITAVADDLIGKMGIEALRAEEVDTRFTVNKRGSSDTAVGLVEIGSGRRTMVLNRTISVKARDLKLSSYPKPRIVHLDGRDIEACIRLAEWGRRAGATVTFDIGSKRNDVSAIFPLVDHLVVADSFALPFTGARSPRQAVEKLQQLCPGVVVVTEGTNGSIGCDESGFVTQRAFKVESVDTTGAGDAFHTGYLYGLLHNLDLKQRLEFGSAVAALKCSRMGARTGIPTLSQVQRFLKKGPQVYA